MGLGRGGEAGDVSERRGVGEDFPAGLLRENSLGAIVIALNPH